ncbi:MAG: HAD family hydrolase [Bauldia sp.]
MPGTIFDVFVFDFDGTLVQSAEAKRKAFFDIFPAVCASAVEAVLSVKPDASRYAVIPTILAEIERRGLAAPGIDTAGLLEAYARTADTGVAAAPEMPGAGDVLERLSSVGSVYIVSMTPHEQLLSHLKQRGWMRYVAGAFGYPSRKVDAIASLLVRHGIAPTRLLVSGDGESDAEAAALNGCRFHKIRRPSDLAKVRDFAVGANV